MEFMPLSSHMFRPRSPRLFASSADRFFSLLFPSLCFNFFCPIMPSKLNIFTTDGTTAAFLFSMAASYYISSRLSHTSSRSSHDATRRRSPLPAMSFVSEASIARTRSLRRRRATVPMRCRRRDDRRRSDSKAICRRLMALKELIPSSGGSEEAEPPPPVNADQLFEDAADYILRLRTQVVILKRLVDFYGIREGNEDVLS